MVSGLPVLVGKACDCGGRLHWQKHGLFRPRWRLECICGRSGPWRSRPEVQAANPTGNDSTSADAPPTECRVAPPRRPDDRPGYQAEDSGND